MHVLPVGMVAERSVHYFCVAPIGVHALPIGIAVLQSVHYFGPSGVRALPLSQLQNEVSPIFGPSRVRVLPVGVAAKRSVHYFCDYFSSFFLFFSATYFSLKRVYATALKLCMARQYIKVFIRKKFRGPPCPTW